MNPTIVFDRFRGFNNVSINRDSYNNHFFTVKENVLRNRYDKPSFTIYTNSRINLNAWHVFCHFLNNSIYAEKFKKLSFLQKENTKIIKLFIKLIENNTKSSSVEAKHDIKYLISKLNKGSLSDDGSKGIPILKAQDLYLTYQNSYICPNEENLEEIKTKRENKNNISNPFTNFTSMGLVYDDEILTITDISIMITDISSFFKIKHHLLAYGDLSSDDKKDVFIINTKSKISELANLIKDTDFGVESKDKEIDMLKEDNENDKNGLKLIELIKEKAKLKTKGLMLLNLNLDFKNHLNVAEALESH